MHKMLKGVFLIILLIPFILDADYIPGIVIARLKRGVVELPQGQTEGDVASIVGNQDLKNYLTKQGLIKIGKLFRRFNAEDTLLQLGDGEIVKVQDLSLVFKLTFDPNANVGTIIDSLNQYSDVIYAESDCISSLLFYPNDDRFGEQWSLNQNSDCDIDADSAWDIETGNYHIKIGIVDEGIDYRHKDLGIYFGPGFKVCGGWDYIDDDNDPRPEWPDGEKHGTHVAGIASALTNNNNIGIAGLSGGKGGTNIGCGLYSYRTQLSGAGSASDQAAAIVKAVSDGMAVINVSLGLDYKEFLREAVCYAYRTRRTFVAARGNQGNYEPEYPACFDHHWVICVGATDRYDQRWESSSLGQGIDVVAPGKDILSTIPVYNVGEERYELNTGTSMAAPHVTGLAALIRSKAWPYDYSLHTEDVEGIIRATAKDLDPPGYDDEYGAGRINAYYALKYFSYRQSLQKYTVTPINCIFTDIYQKVFINVGNLDGIYNVQRFGYYTDIWLPSDTLKFLGIWGLGRKTTGYSDADPNYGEGWCNVEEIPYLPGCYRISSYIYKVWDPETGEFLVYCL
jgi:subtilisin family serine protease